MKFKGLPDDRAVPTYAEPGDVADGLSGLSRRTLFAMAVLAALQLSTPCCVAQTALDDYVAKPDASYGYSVDSTIPGLGFTGYNIDLISQTWRDPTEVIQSWKDPTDVTQNQWEHKLQIARPDGTPNDTAILVIDGGTHPDSFSTSTLAEIGAAAVATNSVVVNLPTVPNQRLKFEGEAFTRTEDEIIAKTFRKFLDNDPLDPNIEEWPLLLPMVKSAVRTIDATIAHMASEGVTINDFFILGGSKRGWTTWLTAAVEARPGGPNRVSGIAPAVIDLLNIDESMENHRRAYEGVTERTTGGYSEEVEDYVLEGVMAELGSARGQELLQIVDPYEYRDRLDLPKYLVNGTGDEFFVPDSSQIYSQDLLGPTYLRYIPNAGHGLDDSALPGVLNFQAALELGLPLPDFSWEISADGTTITVQTSAADTLQNVSMWQANNPINRDFRTYTFGLNWTSDPLTERGPGEYVATIPLPATGATAFMVELEYLVGGPGGLPLKFTTDVSVVEVPEPMTFALVLSGIVAGLVGEWRGKRRRAFREAQTTSAGVI